MTVNQIVPSDFVVTFQSDGSINHSGFILRWECASGDELGPTVTQETHSVNVLEGVEGSVVLENYANSAEHSWMVESDCETVLLESEYMQLEHGYDFVIIAGQEYTGSAVISTILPGSFEILFTSDSSVTADGFRFNWRCAENDVNGTSDNSGSEGTISLLNYPNNYQEQWTIDTQCSTVLIESTIFSTEANYDVLLIGDTRYRCVDCKKAVFAQS